MRVVNSAETQDDHRRPLLRQEEFDSSPRELRANIDALRGLLDSCEPSIHRRVVLTFGELVANWHVRFSGEPISVVVELFPDSVRLRIHNSQRQLTQSEWDRLVSVAVLDLADDWGIDRRLAGRAWFEFRAGE